ncbi:cytochrome C [Geomonas sp.]|uniref:cytochrome C n=1 Tax=Geomonas sp. TaxID=2651584 RepID=UPI002B47AD1E|nr:cytochrome C [Geomonas sp.]HJV34738.1 cytochrome C [Geomonas sp.]
MKKMLLVLVLIACYCAPAMASVKTVGHGDKMTIDPSGLPAAQRDNWNIMKVRCVKCHTMERTIIAINTGVAPVSGQPFDRGAVKAYGVKMLRKPDSNMTKAEVKSCVELMNYLLDAAQK